MDSEIEQANDSRNELAPREEARLLADFKSIYHQLNARPDVDVKIFQESRVVERADIIELNRKVCEKISCYHKVATHIVKCDVVFSDERVQSFALWEQFIQMDWNINKTTKSITVKWEFTIQLPGYHLPQKHNLKVRIGSALRPQEAFHLLMSSEEEFEITNEIVPAFAQVDFINQTIGSELLAIVENWYGALQLTKKYNGVIYNYLNRNSNRLSLLTVLVAMSAGAFGYYGLSKVVLLFYSKYHVVSLTSLEFIRRLFFWWLISIIVMYASYAIGGFLARRLNVKIDRMKPANSLLFTKQDNSSSAEIESINGKIVRAIAGEFLLTIAVSVLLFLTSKLVNMLASIAS